MQDNEELFNLATLARQSGLESLLEALENFSYRNPKLHLAGQLEQLRSEYELMTDFWRRGFKDNDRPRIYARLCQRLRLALLDARVRYANLHTPYLTFLSKKGTDGVIDTDYIELLRPRLEKFVTDMALLELEQPHVVADRRKELLAGHDRLMADVFAALVVSCSWRDGVADSFIELMLSPTVDSMDQQLMVSAVTLACVNFFDVAKFRFLFEVYRRSADLNVRQRALVGWAFCVNGLDDGLDSKMVEAVRAALAEEGVADELAELQMQAIFCMCAEADNRTLHKEIIPDILKYSSRYAAPDGQKSEEDTLRDIIDPEASEREMEKVEQQFRRMMDMQQSGADIYFSGFSQMKRFPFFNTVSNWFVPFYYDNPSISSIMEGKVGKFVRKLADLFPFCNSDKYSFVLACPTSFPHVSDDLMQHLDEAPDSIRERVDESVSNPAYVRRGYLQDFFRFFRLFSSRECFRNPFDENETRPKWLFADAKVFDGTPLRGEENACKLASFLMKKGYDDCAARVLGCENNEGRGYQYYMLCGVLVSRGHAVEGVEKLSDCFAKALESKFDDRKARVALARALFGEGSPQKAMREYEILMGQYPEKYGYALGFCVCQLNSGLSAEALPLLYKLDYEHPDDLGVKRALARAQMENDKLEQAAKIYDSLVAMTADEGGKLEDLPNAGLCYWRMGRMADAAGLFAKFLHTLYPHDTRAELREKFASVIVGGESGLKGGADFDPVELSLMEDEVLRCL